MKVNYTGKLEKLDALSQKKLDARMSKLSKLLDRKSEKDAHVILKQQRQTREAEITLNYYDHPLAAAHQAADSLTALLGACDKMEKQIQKVQAKFRDGKRRAGKPSAAAAAVPAAEAGAPAPSTPKIYRVNPRSVKKPMTAEEAILEMNDSRRYVLYRDAETDRLAVLLRRPDGHFDLIEA
ncbi:MAG: HPF/RaiA family ribosome-associated protein [Bryobacteraceae bacterium]